MKQTVLITGASSGIGKGFAYAYAKKSNNLVLIARSRDKLQKIKSDLEQRYEISVDFIMLDLAEIGASTTVIKKVKEAGLSIDVVINNAGFSTKGLFGSADLKEQRDEMMVNMLTLTELAHLFTKEWAGQRGKTIINLASAAAFQATPYSAVYSASKAYVLSLTEALHIEYKDRGIFYLAVCSGPTDTAFFDKIGDFGFSKKRTVEQVVATTFRAIEKNKMVAKDGWLTVVRSQINRVLPRKTITKIVGRIAGKYWENI
ncbi:hypothetical protein BAU15_07790 [Enterococcus sp. JM4C]|uniref:SDR family NAD(P)-dependent oxidoreductase n=1 Tax=Candidatus Enterococcus huntleyi TaxID=1857217 RepID=UPI0013796036|nr:SDR family oxidoreductase [Enterococcus sp. JM4C]KAF1297604.1 hypothetical protein BAU15_07790 [Enterococcus sp. JM4C]